MNNTFLPAENQFLNPPLQQSQIRGSRAMSTDALIDRLQLKNNSLKRQVNKVDQVLSSIKLEEKPRYGLVLPQIKPDAVKKELQNAYKQIKIYQYEIQRRRNTVQGQNAYVQEFNKIERIYREKVQLHEKLKREMLLLKNQSKELTKMLKNNSMKRQYQNKESKLVKDVKYLQETVREHENKRKLHIEKLEKQRAAIRQMQQEFLSQNSNEALESVKFRIFKPNPEGDPALTPSRAILDIQNEAAQQQSRVTKTQMSMSREVVQDRTPEAYQNLQNSVRILTKMQNDYQQKILFLTKERDEATEKNFKSRNKLLQVEFEIQTIEKNILQLKKMIDPKIFKPKKPLVENKKEVKKKIIVIPHNFKYLQVGQITKNGKRFTDGIIVGKHMSKIIGVIFYAMEYTNQFVGLQAVYETNKTTKKGKLNLLADPKKVNLKQETLELGLGDYFKTIDLFLKKEKVVGISMVSKNNKVAKSGEFSGQRKTLQMEHGQYPMVFFGSLLQDGFECFGVQVAEEKPNQS